MSEHVEAGPPGTPSGLQLGPVTSWLAEHTDLAPPVTASTIAGGRSNLTYLLEDASGQRLVIRRPPLRGVLESAHDVAREYRIQVALAPTDVPVPICLGLEEDAAVTGAPFYAMRFVDGVVARDTTTASTQLNATARRASGRSMIEALVRLHDVDIDAVGLGELARREGYLDRQLRRWYSQLEHGATRELPVLDEVHRRLAADIPSQGPATLVHGDYRLDNVILDPGSGAVRAVLDWELTTLGDPLADLGLLLVYWEEPGADDLTLPGPPTLAPGFSSREQLVEWYARSSDRDVSGVGYHVAFGYWKLACILEGVHRRYLAGAYGSEAIGFDRLGDLVVALGERALEAARQVGR